MADDQPEAQAAHGRPANPPIWLPAKRRGLNAGREAGDLMWPSVAGLEGLSAPPQAGPPQQALRHQRSWTPTGVRTSRFSAPTAAARSRSATADDVHWCVPGWVRPPLTVVFAARVLSADGRSRFQSRAGIRWGEQVRIVFYQRGHSQSGVRLSDLPSNSSARDTGIILRR